MKNIQLIHRETIEKIFKQRKTAWKLLFQRLCQWLLQRCSIPLLEKSSFTDYRPRFPKRSSESKWIVPPVKCVLSRSARQSRGPRDSPASKFLLHSLPSPRASPTTSTLGTLVIFVKEAPSASLRPEGGERAAEHTCIYITRRNERKRERERLVFTWPSGLSTPPLLFRSSSGGSLQTEPPRPLAASFKPFSAIRKFQSAKRFHGSATIKRG